VLAALGSLSLTLVALVLLAAGTQASYLGWAPFTWTLSLPLALLAVNLLAAILTNAKFRAQLPLLAFHLALLAIIALVALGRMTYFKAQFELAAGETFDGTGMAGVEHGPWHGFGIDRLRFVSEGARVLFRDGRYRSTTSRVALADGSAAEFATQRPLAIDGYRFYPTFNQGFAPTFVWMGNDGEWQQETFNLPPWPQAELQQDTTWTPDALGRELWVMLAPDGKVLSSDGEALLAPPPHRLVVRDGDTRHELRPGDFLTFDAGRLAYLGLNTWHGYAVNYDWTRPWLLAAATAAVLSLAWHYWRKWLARPWQPRYAATPDQGQ
jgi:cytochrome c biogenesis protein